MFFGMRIFPTWENSIFYMRNQKRSETIFLQYCMFNILPILNFKDFSYCCNFEHNYPDNQKIRNCLSLSFTRRDRSTPYLQTKYFGTVQCSDFILKEHRKNDLKNNVYSVGVVLGFQFLDTGLSYCCTNIVQCRDFDSADLQFRKHIWL